MVLTLIPGVDLGVHHSAAKMQTFRTTKMNNAQFIRLSEEEPNESYPPWLIVGIDTPKRLKISV